eukprot:scaffold3024_cov98-Attheya_sp.AAC.1
MSNEKERRDFLLAGAYGRNTKRPPENAHAHPRSASGRAQSSQMGACAPMGAYFSRITLPLRERSHVVDFVTLCNGQYWEYFL